MRNLSLLKLMSLTEKIIEAGHHSSSIHYLRIQNKYQLTHFVLMTDYRPSNNLIILSRKSLQLKQPQTLVAVKSRRMRWRLFRSKRRVEKTLLRQRVKTSNISVKLVKLEVTILGGVNGVRHLSLLYQLLVLPITS